MFDEQPDQRINATRGLTGSATGYEYLTVGEEGQCRTIDTRIRKMTSSSWRRSSSRRSQWSRSHFLKGKSYWSRRRADPTLPAGRKSSPKAMLGPTLPAARKTSPRARQTRLCPGPARGRAGPRGAGLCPRPARWRVARRRTAGGGSEPAAGLTADQIVSLGAAPRVRRGCGASRP